MRSLKQLFCKHVWKEVDEEFLERKRMPMSRFCYVNYNYYAVHRKCVKCDYAKIKQRRVIMI